jgi:F-type H+-transporting ATPase subunit epsilon
MMQLHPSVYVPDYRKPQYDDGSLERYTVHQVAMATLTRLGIGELSYRDASGWHYLSAADGFVEVLPTRVTIVAFLCEAAREIDVERAREARRRAEESYKQAAKLSDQDMLMVELSMKRALTRLLVAGRTRT